MQTQLSDEVFVFDVEVEPLLQVIVGKTMEQALLEVESEEELMELEGEAGRLGNEKREEVERIEEMDRNAARVWREKKEKYDREVEFAKAQDQVRAKVAAVRCLKQILPGLKGEVYQGKIDRGEWEINDIKSTFLPWLFGEIEGRMEGRRKGEEAMDGMIKAALEEGVSREEEAKEGETKRLKDIEDEKERKKRERVGKVKINITAGSVGLEEDKVVGPLDITGVDTVNDLEDKIKIWLKDADVKFDEGERGFLQLGYEGKVLGGDTVVLDIPGGGELSVLANKRGEEEKE